LLLLLSQAQTGKKGSVSTVDHTFEERAMMANGGVKGGQKGVADGSTKSASNTKRFQRKCGFMCLLAAFLFELAVVLTTYFVMRRTNENAIERRKASIVRRIQRVIEIRQAQTQN
jgi:hypothetical protein